MLDVGWVWLTDYETGKSFRIGLVFATDYCRYEKTLEFITLNTMSVSVIDLHIHTPLVNCVRYGLNGGCLYQVWLWYEHESNPR